MNESLLIKLAIVILFLPLIGFTVAVFFGKKIKYTYLIEIFTVGSAFLLSIILMYFKLTLFVDKEIVSEFTWINFWDVPVLGSITINLGLLLDNLSVIMIFTVMFVSFFVHLYSVAYMKSDIRYGRYFAYLGLFTFSMAGIVLTHNFLMMYIFWELVGVSSYLLIGFWFEKKSASDAGKKAFIVNRIGDIGMLLGILVLYMTYNTFTFDEIFSAISNGHLPYGTESGLTIAGLLLFCGAIGKSAQFPLHVWLPDAMEGPTPVSALIHAATMVAAGVYFVARIFTMLTGDALLIIAAIGALSALIPATIALTQNDIKRVLAYSTISQLGYMIMALGVGAYAFAFLHLITHAFFKACLFLGSGSVIHAMHHEQDIQKMGGLRKKMPYTYATFLIASLALSGIPLTSGFLSKDGILAGTYAFASLTGHWMFPAVGFLVAMLTAFYMFRLIILTFHSAPKDQHKFEHAQESPKLIVIPLVVLALFSLFFWFTPNPINADAGAFLSKWIKAPEISVPDNSRYEFMKEGLADLRIGELADSKIHEITYSEVYTEAMHSAHYPAMILSLIMALSGIGFAFLMYQYKRVDSDKLAVKLKVLYNISYNKWYFDEFYNKVFVGGTIGICKMLRWFDDNIIDGIVNGSAYFTKGFSDFSGKFDNVVVDGLVNFMAYLSAFFGLIFRKFQTGKVQTYIVLVIFSIVILLFLFKPF
jgi:NADH-quinone oxidoreductase subunit L